MCLYHQYHVVKCHEYNVVKYDGVLRLYPKNNHKLFFGQRVLLISRDITDDDLQEVASAFTCIIKDFYWRQFTMFSFSRNTFYASP